MTLFNNFWTWSNIFVHGQKCYFTLRFCLFENAQKYLTTIKNIEQDQNVLNTYKKEFELAHGLGSCFLRQNLINLATVIQVVKSVYPKYHPFLSLNLNLSTLRSLIKEEALKKELAGFFLQNQYVLITAGGVEKISCVKVKKQGGWYSSWKLINS